MELLKLTFDKVHNYLVFMISVFDDLKMVKNILWWDEILCWGWWSYDPKGTPPFLTPPLKRGSKRLTFFWVHIFHTRSGGSIQTPLTNGGPFCPLLGGDPSPPGGGYPSIWGSQICWKFYVKKLVSKVSKFWSFLGVQTFVPSLTFLIKVTTLKVSIFMIQKGYTIILSPFLRGLGPYPP